MKKDYSWEDQDPEEMQEWHEFQGSLTERANTDSVAFTVHDSEQPIFDTDDDELDDDLEPDELDFEIKEELSAILTPSELEIVCSIRGIGRRSMPISEIEVSLGLALEDIASKYSAARSKLAAIPKYKNFLPPIV